MPQGPVNSTILHAMKPKVGLPFWAVRWVSLLLLVSLAIAPLASNATTRSTYHVEFDVALDPETSSASVRIDLSKRAQYVRWIRFKIDPKVHSDFKGSGHIQHADNTVLWEPRGKKGWLTFNVKIKHQRSSGRFDALITEDWALFRGFDIVPQARIDMKDGTQSKSKLRFQLPEDWSVVAPYARYTSGAYKIDHAHRLFDRPTGWMLAGKMGIKRDTIEGVYVTVAAPKGQGARRMDILAHLNWNLGPILEVFPDFPPRLLIVSAGDPMWRGALSGPGSLYVHADRPLISEDGTSPILHELVHVAMSARSAPGADWLIEGIAEYYSLEFMRRSGTITEKRYQKSHQQLAKRGESVKRLDVDLSYGDVTAKAVSLIKMLDEELRRKTNDKMNVDDIVRELADHSGNVTVDLVRSIAKRITGVELDWQPTNAEKNTAKAAAGVGID